MKTSTKIITVVLITGLVGIGTAIARGGPGGCHNGFPGMMMHGPGGFGGNPGMMMRKQMGPMGRFGDRKLNLSETQVRTMAEARLIMRGNDRLKIGKIAKKGEDSYLIDIVTVDDSLVRQVEIDKNSGLPTKMVKAMAAMRSPKQ